MAYEHKPRSPEEITLATEDTPDGTFCPRCKYIYIGRETILGRPPGFENRLHEITRCDNCNFLVAW